MHKLLFFKLIFLLLIIFLFNGCANIVAPSGGEGDKTPPVVKNASIKQAQTNFSDAQIALEFNKFMNRNTVAENIIISPTTRFLCRWKGKKVSIIFSDSLKENTTYSIQLGGAFSDYFGNVAKEPYFIYFSTGDIIDTGKIEGKIITEKAEGYYIFCYIIDGFASDSAIDTASTDSTDEIKIDYLTKIPDYKVQIGTSGNFTIPALKDGKYRVIAVRDADKDGLVTQIRDTIGVPVFDPVVQNGVSDFVQIIPNQIIDIIPPEVIDLSAVSQNEVVIIFSEQILLDTFDAPSIYLSYRNDTNRIEPAAFYVDNPDNIKEINLAFKESIKSEKPYNINLDSAKSQAIRDASNNFLVLPIKNILLVDTDSVPPQTTVTAFPISDLAKNINVDTNFVITFSNPVILSDDISNKIKLFKDSMELELLYSQPFSNQIAFIPKQKLEEQAMYRFEINCSDLRDIWDNILVDTSNILNFETGRQAIFSHFNGKIIDSNQCDFPRYLRIKSKNEQGKSVEYTAKIGADNTFSFPRILPGEYSIMYFCDLNENGKYDFGSLHPFAFAEPFALIEQTVTIRARWSIDDYIIEIK